MLIMELNARNESHLPCPIGRLGCTTDFFADTVMLASIPPELDITSLWLAEKHQGSSTFSSS